jgi:hypothetical protein
MTPASLGPEPRLVVSSTAQTLRLISPAVVSLQLEHVPFDALKRLHRLPVVPVLVLASQNLQEHICICT